MNVTNVVYAVFGSSRHTVAEPLHQWDKGQVLKFKNLSGLPEYYAVHFSNERVGGVAKTFIGNSNGVGGWDEYLETGKPVYAWLYLSAGEDDGKTMRSVEIQVIKRPRPVDIEPTPQEQSQIDVIIDALNTGVARAETAATNAETSETNAKTSEDNAKESELNAKASEDAVTESAERAEQAAESAEASASSASQSATNASESATLAESWAVGGTGTRQGEDTNNSKYYAESTIAAKDEAILAKTQAESARDLALQAKDSAQASAQTATQKASEATQSAADASQSATSAQGSATGASQSAALATSAKEAAQTAQGLAEDAKDEAVTAREEAETAQQEAEAEAQSIAQSASQIAQNTEDISDLKSAFEEIITVTNNTNLCNPDALVVGLVNSSGVVDSSYTTRLTTEFIPVGGTYVSAYCHQTGYSDIGGVRVAFYNRDKTLKNIIITSSAITLPTDGASFVRVSFAHNWAYYFVGFSNTDTKVPFEEYEPSSYAIREGVLPSRITATDNWLYKFAECDFVGGNVHLSIDDVGYALYLLTTESPSSIWENAFFAQLKALHETYGVCVTCNCFSFLSTEQSYDIANVPNTWASEFVSAKEWLKFAFHAKDNTINYSTATTMKSDYEYFVNAIYHMTGDYDCIDTGTRLTMFTGTKEQLEETMKLEHGITMLWAADDNRDCYYFDSSQTARVNNRGKYIDDITNLLFVKSMPRLDNHTIDDISPLIAEKPQYGKLVELYCHENLSGTIESGTVTRLNNALAWFNTNGYESHFLTEIFI